MQQGGSAALVLQDAGLRSLDRVLSERERLPAEMAPCLAVGLCRVLEGVHGAGVVHKAIKPQTILVLERCAGTKDLYSCNVTHTW